jgi:hypothetical protein
MHGIKLIGTNNVYGPYTKIETYKTHLQADNDTWYLDDEGKVYFDGAWHTHEVVAPDNGDTSSWIIPANPGLLEKP